MHRGQYSNIPGHSEQTKPVIHCPNHFYSTQFVRARGRVQLDIRVQAS